MIFFIAYSFYLINTLYVCFYSFDGSCLLQLCVTAACCEAFGDFISLFLFFLCAHKGLSGFVMIITNTGFSLLHYRIYMLNTI